MSDEDRPGLSRRGFLKGLGLGTAGAALTGLAPGRAEASLPAVGEGDPVRSVTLVVNGASYRMQVEPRRTLAQVLREDLGLTGTKVACDRASCGACTVLVEGRAVFSCHLLAVQAHAKPIETIEGLAPGEDLHPVQQAFIDCDASQCGFCTPGMIMAIKGCLDRRPGASREEMKHAISGNFCRCGAYNHILDAAMKAGGKQEGGER